MNTESGATVRRIGTNGFITSVAGGNGLGFSGDNGKATAAQLAINEGVAADASGNFYIADSTNNRIRGLATSATVNGVQSLALDSSGNVYFTDIGNQRVRKLTPVLVAASGVLNAASQLPGAVAPGEIVAINFTGIVADNPRRFCSTAIQRR